MAPGTQVVGGATPFVRSIKTRPPRARLDAADAHQEKNIKKYIKIKNLPLWGRYGECCPRRARVASVVDVPRYFESCWGRLETGSLQKVAARVRRNAQKTAELQGGGC